MPLENGSFKSFLLTINNYTDKDIERIFTFTKADISYLEFCKEVAPTTGTPHIHIYVTFRNTHRCNVVRKMFPTPVSDVKVARDRIPCLEYIRKGGNSSVIDFRHGRTGNAQLVTKSGGTSQFPSDSTLENQVDKILERSHPRLKISSIFPRRR